MGNRAYVIFEENDGQRSPAVYLHWNGGPESVYTFVETLGKLGVTNDASYRCARFCQLVGNFFKGGLSLGVVNSNGPVQNLDPGDNGVYIFGSKRVQRWVDGHWYTAEQIAAEQRAAREHTYNVNDGLLTDLLEQGKAVAAPEG